MFDFDDILDGKGVAASDDGERLYEGYFKDGHVYGRGRMISSLGNGLYHSEGEWKNNVIYNGTCISIDSKGKKRCVVENGEDGPE